MQYEIHQIKMSSQETNLVNQLGWAEAGLQNPKVRASFETMVCKNVDKHFREGHYTKVALVEADDLEHVFEIGNGIPGGKITRLEQMHSVSVGDVIRDETGVYHMVQSFGFGVITL